MDKKKITKKQVNEKLARLIRQNKAEKAKIKHIKLTFMENRFGPLIFVLLFGGIGGFFIFHSSAAPQPKATGPSSSSSSSAKQPRSSSATIWLQPATQVVTPGSSVTAEVWVDTANELVNAVQADLTYPLDKLKFVSIDASTSDFGVQAQADGANGKVAIARGSINPVRGKHIIAKVTFKPVATSGQAEVKVDDSSSVLRSTDNSNILSVRTGANYTLSN